MRCRGTSVYALTFINFRIGCWTEGKLDVKAESTFVLKTNTKESRQVEEHALKEVKGEGIFGRLFARKRDEGHKAQEWGVQKTKERKFSGMRYLFDWLRSSMIERNRFIRCFRCIEIK